MSPVVNPRERHVGEHGVVGGVDVEVAVLVVHAAVRKIGDCCLNVELVVGVIDGGSEVERLLQQEIDAGQLLQPIRLRHCQVESLPHPS